MLDSVFLPTLFVGLVLFIEQETDPDPLVLLFDRLLQHVRDRANNETKDNLLSDEIRKKCVEEVRSHVSASLHPTLRSDINICLTILEPVTSSSSFSFSEILRSANQMLASPPLSSDFSATRYLRNQLGSIRQQHEARKTTGDEKSDLPSAPIRSSSPLTTDNPTELKGSAGSVNRSAPSTAVHSDSSTAIGPIGAIRAADLTDGMAKNAKTKEEEEQEERMRRIREEMRKMQ